MTRDSNIYVTRRVRKCLAKIAELEGGQIDALADGVLEHFITDQHPYLWAFYTRHEAEEKALLDTMKKPKV